MSSSLSQDWLMMPDIVFDDIMMMIDIDSLRSCSQVCRTWHRRIMSNVWGNPSKRNVIKKRIERSWGPEMLPSEEDISRARWFGKYRLLLNLLQIFLFQKREAFLKLN